MSPVLYNHLLRNDNDQSILFVQSMANTDKSIIKILSFLKKQKIEFIRVVWCDTANIIRSKAFHISHIQDYAFTGVGISKAQQALPVMYDAPCCGSGLGPVGEVSLIPDWNTLSILPYAPTHARVMGDMVMDRTSWQYCPREFLRSMVSKLYLKGYTLRAAFENEFYLFNKNTSNLVLVDDTVFAQTYSMDMHYECIKEITSALCKQGLNPEQYYPEVGPGQLEISVDYADALDACDRQIIFRETVKAIALHFGYIASFVPKPIIDKAGSGCHLHMSLWKNNKNCTGNNKTNELSQVSKLFIAGILKHLPSLMVITTPSTNSYKRIKPHFWSGAYTCWGVDNREAAIRIPSGRESSVPTNFELKTCDASSNPYLALGAVIAAGIDGIENSIAIPEPILVDPGDLSYEEQQKRSVQSLPTSLSDSISLFEKNPVLLNAFGKDFFRAIVSVRKAEWAAMKDLSHEEEVKLLLERY